MGSKAECPRVACRECGLVVHTRCYGLLGHDEKQTSRKVIGRVDQKGLFTCDVCASSTTQRTNKKQRWSATQSSGWRTHDPPFAICPLCERQDIAGGMIHIVPEEDVSKGRKSRKRKSSRSNVGLSDCWVHLFCLNALQSSPPNPCSIRTSKSAGGEIQEALQKADENVKEMEVRLLFICGRSFTSYTYYSFPFTDRVWKR